MFAGYWMYIEAYESESTAPFGASMIGVNQWLE